MSRFRHWLERLLGLQTEVEQQVEQAVRLNVALAGAVTRAAAVAEAEMHAAELERTHPHLAAVLRAAIAEHAAGTPLDGPAPLVGPPATEPVELPESSPKRVPGRPRKAAELPPASQPGGN